MAITTITSAIAPALTAPADDRLQRALYDLIIELERLDELPRRREVRAILQRRLYFRGEQYWWWSEYQGLYFPPWEKPANLVQEAEDEPTFQHVTNIFQAFGLSVMSVLTQNSVPARFWPQNPRNPKDVQTSKSATRVVDFVHRNNEMKRKADDAAYYLWTDGFVGAWARFERPRPEYGAGVDGEANPENAGPAAVTASLPAQARCPECGTTAPTPPGQATPENFYQACPECGAAMALEPSESLEAPPEAAGPGPEGIVPTPEQGMEVIEVIPALHLKRSMRVDSQREFLYLTIVKDVHRAAVKDEFARNDEALAGSLDTAAGETGTDTYERLARRLLYEGSQRHATGDLENIGTLRRSWLRPAAFWQMKDSAVRSELFRRFPQGVRATYFGDKFCEWGAECMDEAWATMHAMPGEGQFREALGSIIMSVQDQLNDGINLVFETAMYGVPEAFVNQDAINMEARRKQAALPGNLTPLQPQVSGQPVGDLIHSLPASEPSAALARYVDQLFGEIPQFLTGAFPALMGGSQENIYTASGYAQAINQAMGRIGRCWRRMQEWWAQTDLLAVQCFARNRAQDVDRAVLGPEGEWDTDTISLADLRGNVVAYPEVDQQYPTVQAQVRALLAEMSKNDVTFQALMQKEPEVMEYVYRELGLQDISIPGEDSRLKQLHEIRQMLGEAAQTVPGQMDPLSGQAAPDIQVPTVVPDEFTDNHAVELDTCLRWINSAEGQIAKRDNPRGYSNVRLHALAHMQFMKLAQFKSAVAAKGVAAETATEDLGGAQDIAPPPEPAGPGGGAAPPAGPPGGQPAQPGAGGP